jgi:hypothetical protein
MSKTKTSELDNLRSRTPVFDLVSCRLLSCVVRKVLWVEQMSLTMIRAGDCFRPLPLYLHGSSTSILRVFLCGPEVDLQGAQKKQEQSAGGGATRDVLLVQPWQRRAQRKSNSYSASRSVG